MKSKKGVESFPFFLFLTLLIAAFVITIGFYQVRTFSEFSSTREFANSYKNLINAMENLRKSADYGSFTRVKLKIPNNYEVIINPKDDTIIIKNDKELKNKLEFDIIAITDKYNEIHYDNFTLKHGEYELVVYYGEVIDETEALEIFFV